eukprot:765523-Hanusia_phi.AAC.4
MEDGFRVGGRVKGDDEEEGQVDCTGERQQTYGRRERERERERERDDVSKQDSRHASCKAGDPQRLAGDSSAGQHQRLKLRRASCEPFDQVVKDHFGAASECVCAALIRRSQRTLKELQADTELTSAALKNNLLVLIQHNLVRTPPHTPAVATEGRCRSP